MGTVDLYFDCGLHVWDFAGPALIVTEVIQINAKQMYCHSCLQDLREAWQMQ